jgi:hypothetical protein
MGRGAHDVHLYTQSLGGEWMDKGLVQFAEAPGSDDYTGLLFSDLNWTGIRYIKFDILNIWGDGDTGGHCGLSEVQFFTAESNTVPEPASMLLLGLGVLGLAGLRRIS